MCIPCDDYADDLKPPTVVGPRHRKDRIMPTITTSSLSALKQSWEITGWEVRTDHPGKMQPVREMVLAIPDLIAEVERLRALLDVRNQQLAESLNNIQKYEKWFDELERSEDGDLLDADDVAKALGLEFFRDPATAKSVFRATT